MPLYETIVICKPGPSRRTINLMKSVGDYILGSGGKNTSPGNVREIQILGDRILCKDLKGKDMYRYSVGRYVQFLHDSHPSVLENLNKTIKSHPESLARYCMRSKDLSDEAIAFRRTIKMATPIVSASERNTEFMTAMKHLKAKMTV